MINITYIRFVKGLGIYELPVNINKEIINDDKVSVKLLGYQKFESDYFNLFLDPYGVYSSLSESDREKVNIDNKINNLNLIHNNSAIIKITVQIDIATIDITNTEDFWNNPPHKKIEEKIFSALTTSFSLCRNSNISPEYEFIDDGYFAIKDKKVLKKFSPVITIDGPTMSRLTSEEMDTAIFLSDYLYKDKKMDTIIYLFSQSLIPNEVGRLHSFISAWTCLEIFIAKNFDQSLIFAKEKLKNPEIHNSFTERVFNVMEGKYRIMEKFTLLSSYYKDPKIEDNIIEFKSLKKTRDSFFHGEKIEIEKLPLERIRALFLHLFKLKLKSELG